MSRALITGIDGQDGSYLAELLLDKGYEVHGLVRRVGASSPSARHSRIAHIQDRLHLHGGDVQDYASVLELVRKAKPDECYHLAAQSFVAESFKDPSTTMSINVGGTLHMLMALRALAPECRFYFAASSEMYGGGSVEPMSERSPFHPRSPYAVSKVAGFNLTQLYYEAYGMYACSGILFNHESPRRGEEFVTRKITRAVGRIAHGLQDELYLGNLDARRDWGFAGDYVRVMHLMLQRRIPVDYVVGTGVTRSVREFVEAAFNRVSLDYEQYVKVDPVFYRPAEVHVLGADANKAKHDLGWKPEWEFRKLVEVMVDHDMELARREARA